MKAPGPPAAQLQGQHGPRHILRQKAGVLPGGLLPGRLQDAGRQAVLGLIAGDADLPVQGGGVDEGGSGAGKGHVPQRLQRLQRRGGEDAGEPLPVQVLRRQPQQGRGGAVDEPAGHVHHLPLPVGDDLRQQKGNPAVPEGPCELVQMLCHSRALLSKAVRPAGACQFLSNFVTFLIVSARVNLCQPVSAFVNRPVSRFRVNFCQPLSISVPSPAFTAPCQFLSNFVKFCPGSLLLPFRVNFCQVVSNFVKLRFFRRASFGPSKRAAPADNAGAAARSLRSLPSGADNSGE